MITTRISGFILVISLLLSGCGEETLSPEAEIRAMLEAGEAAVESRSVTAVADFVADEYLDEAKRQRRDLMRMLTGYFLTHQKINLLVQINRITLTDPKHAEVTLYAAVAGRPGASLEEMLAVRADLVRFDMKLEKRDEEWLVVSSIWRRASRADFSE